MPRRDAAELVKSVIATICARLIAGEAVKTCGLGAINLRDGRTSGAIRGPGRKRRPWPGAS